MGINCCIIITIINTRYKHIIFIAYVPLKKCDKQQNVAVTELLPLSVQKADRETFCTMSGIGPVTARPAPQRQISCPVSTAHRSDLCKNVSLQCHLVATVIHTPSVRSQTCVHIHI